MIAKDKDVGKHATIAYTIVGRPSYPFLLHENCELLCEIVWIVSCCEIIFVNFDTWNSQAESESE